MKLKQTTAVLRKEWWHITRDRRTALLVTLSPVLFLVVMAYSFSVEIKRVDIAVVDLDGSSASRDLVGKLEGSGDLHVCCRTDSYQEAEEWLVDGSAKAILVFPPDFSRNIAAARTPSLQVIVDGTDPSTANHAIDHIMSRAEAFGIEAAASSAGRDAPDEAALPIDLRVRTLYNPSLRYVIGVVPAMIAVVLAMPALAASLAITREKEWGTLETLICTPIGRVDLFTGKLIPYVVSGLISVVLCAIVAIAWFRVPFRGSFPLYMGLSALYLYAALSLALVISVLVSSQQAAMLVSLLVFLFPGFFLSGILIPLSAMGELRYEALIFPTSHYVLINRGLFLKGVGIDVLWPWAVVLVLFGTAMLALSMVLFKKRLK